MIDLRCGDCLDVIRGGVKNGSIDLIVTDPPYLIKYKTNHRKNKQHDFCREIQNDNNPKVISSFFEEAYRVLKENSAMYVFTSWKTGGRQVNRPIKFRAWSKTYKRLFDVFCFIPNHIIPWVKTGDRPDWKTILDSDDCVLLQYTGQNDENGTEIYEGDIVIFEDCSSTESGYCERGCMGEVFWDKETGSWCVTNRLSAESYEVMNEGCIIIGNIFENPELLGASNE